MIVKPSQITGQAAVLIFTLCLAAASPGLARKMYLSTNGDDSAQCAEFRTLSRAGCGRHIDHPQGNLSGWADRAA